MDPSDAIIIALLMSIISSGTVGLWLYITNIQQQKNVIESQLKLLRGREQSSLASKEEMLRSIHSGVGNEPLTRDVRVVPINIQTQKVDSYKQVGILSSNEEPSKVLPLYGRRTVNGSSKWNYYTSTDSYHSFDISVAHKNKDCSDEYGCEELMSGDVIEIPAYNTPFTVNMYRLRGPTYIPYVD